MDLVAQWSYEKIRGELAQLSPGTRPEERRTLWIVRRAVGAARNASGAFEIFLAGPPLSCRSRLVRKHLEHNNWVVEEDGEEVAASRLVLPAAEPYPAVAALIIVELLRAGVGT